MSCTLPRAWSQSLILCWKHCWCVEMIGVQILDWIHDVGEQYLANHTTVGNSLEDTQALLREHNEFKSASKVERWASFYSLTVLLMQMAIGMIL